MEEEDLSRLMRDVQEIKTKVEVMSGNMINYRDFLAYAHRVDSLESKIKRLEKNLEKKASKEEFAPVKKIVFAIIATAAVFLLKAILGLVVVAP